MKRARDGPGNVAEGGKKAAGSAPPLIRPAMGSDLPAITEIYNEAILRTNATFDTVPKRMVEQREWFAHHGKRYPVIVAVLGGEVAGWASLSRWSDRCAYSETAELSLYVREGMRDRGIGKALMVAIMEEGRKAGLHTVIARITEGNARSVHLHESAGFESVGVMREVGRKFGRRLDVQMMQLVYSRRRKGR